MAIPKFDEKELIPQAESMGFYGKIPTYSYPVTPKEAMKAMFERKPVWQTIGAETSVFTPACCPDNIARAFVFEQRPFNPNNGGGPDMFGIEWEYVPIAGGSMVRPGHPFMDDANEWYDKVVWPDPESWDWKGAAEANRDYLNSGKSICFWIMNGWYERLIAFMEFEGAIMAMADEDQQDAVKKLYDRLSDLYIKMIDLALEYMPEIDYFCIHDDWGSQKETFFSPKLAGEMIVPYMKRVTDHIHSKGRYAELHSCGQNYKQVPNMIAAGWDMWNPQPMNDTHKIYEEYGDKLIIGVVPEMTDAEHSTPEQQVAEADAFVAKFCSDPARPCTINKTSGRVMTEAFGRELYKASRLAYEEN